MTKVKGKKLYLIAVILITIYFQISLLGLKFIINEKLFKHQ